jgi:hypothetical protein
MPAHFRTSLDAAASLLVLPCGVALAAEPLIRLIVRGDDVGSSQASPRPRHARDAGGGARGYENVAADRQGVTDAWTSPAGRS